MLKEMRRRCRWPINPLIWSSARRRIDADARLYLERGADLSVSRKCEAWVEWMLAVTAEACRVSRGLVLWVCAGVTRDHCYQPGPEGLLYRWWARGGQCWRPCYWHRVGIPGSGGKQWLRADVEYVLAFKLAGGPIPWADNTINGHPPKWGPGGEMSNRLGDGRRVNQWGGSPTERQCSTRRTDGSRQPGGRPSHVVTTIDRAGPFGNQQSSVGRRPNGTPKPPYFNGNSMRVTRGTGPTGEQLPNCETPLPVLANPGNLVKAIVGGGAMGHDLAHQNEAPYPQALAEWFVRSHCPPGGTVLDPFSGSATTVAAAGALGRRGIGLDLRMSQCLLARRRLTTPARAARPRPEPESAREPGLFDTLPAEAL